MAQISLIDENGDLGFGEEFNVEFEVEVEYTDEPYIPESYYGPAEGGNLEINGYDFKMKITPADNSDKNKMLESFFNYDTLNEEKKKEINDWISNKLDSYRVRDKLIDHAESMAQDYDDSERDDYDEGGSCHIYENDGDDYL
jgi:hypothetical protein